MLTRMTHSFQRWPRSSQEHIPSGQPFLSPCSYFSSSSTISSFTLKMASITSSNDAESTAAPTAALNSQQRRAIMHEMIQAAVSRLPALPDNLEEYDIFVPVHDGWLSRVKIVRPKADLPANDPSSSISVVVASLLANQNSCSAQPERFQKRMELWLLFQATDLSLM
jgi:hypothetical protein